MEGREVGKSNHKALSTEYLVCPQIHEKAQSRKVEVTAGTTKKHVFPLGSGESYTQESRCVEGSQAACLG